MEAGRTNDIDVSLRILDVADLQQPDRPLVEAFLTDAVECKNAARYLVQRCSSDTDGTKVMEFMDDWKALVKICKYTLTISIRKHLTG